MDTTGNKNQQTERQSFKDACSLRWFGVLILTALALVKPAQGQSMYQGTIAGTVTDSSGAMIKGAHVQITSEDTHFVTPATTNDSGAYSAPFLTPGAYTVKVEASGFTPEEQTGALLTPGAIKEVDFKLVPGSTTASVTVMANSELLETGSSTINATITPNIIENTVNTGDTVFYLSTRLPGVYGNFVQGSERQNWVVQSNGQIAAENGVSGHTLVNYDGILDTMMQGDPSQAGGAGFSPPPFSTQELSVKTAEFDAQYGHNNGGVYDLVLKSGTPQFHGAAFFTDENTAYDANYWQRKHVTPQLSRPNVNYVEEGFNVTGPVRIPKLYHGRDKTYFMFGYQHLWFNLPQQTSNVLVFSVPTLLERQGDFSEIASAGGVIYDPTTTVPQGAPSNYASWCAGNPGGCYAGERESFTQEYNEGPGNPSLCNGDINCIPQSRWNTVGATLAGAIKPTGYNYSIYPAPNQTSASANTPYIGNYQAAHFAYVTYYHGLVARLDHEFNDQNKMHVSYSRSFLNQVSNDNQGFPDDELGSSWVQTLSDNNLTVADFTRVISPTSVLDLHSGFSWHPVLVNRQGQHYNPTGLGMAATLPAVLENFPGIGTLSGVGGNYQGLQAGQGANDSFYFWDNTAMIGKSLAKHNLKAGAEFLLYRDDEINSTSTLGSFNASSAFTQNNVTSGPSASKGFGDGVASLLLGYATGASTPATINPKPAYGWHYYALFLQDDWRVNNKFTLNLGVRYDYESPVTERHNWMDAGFNPQATQPFCLPNASGTAISSCQAPPTTAPGSPGYFGGLTFIGNGVKLPFHRELLDRFQPRIGGAYRLTKNDVLRGGFGVTIGPSPKQQSNSGFSSTTSFNSSVNSNFTPPTCSQAQGGDEFGFCTLTNPYPNGIVQPTGNLLGLSTFLGQNINVQDQNYAYPHTTLYVLGVQHQFPSQLLLDVSYHGAYTSGLGVAKNINALPACYYAGGGCPGSGITSILNANVANPMAGYLPASSGLNSAKLAQQSLYVPFPEFGQVNVTYYKLNGKRLGVVNYNAMYVEVTKRFTHGLEFHLSTTWAKVMDQLSYTNSTDAQPARYLDQQPSRLLEFDSVYRLPGVHSENRVLRGLLNGWVWAASENWDQATGYGPPGGAFWTGADVRAKHQTQSHWFNNCYIPLVSQATTSSGPVWGTAQHAEPGVGIVSGCMAGEQPAWIQQPNFTLNTLNPNTLMGSKIRYPEGVYFNSSLGKSIPIHDRLSLELKADVANVVNNTVLIGSIQGGLTSSTFGQDTGLTQNNDPRFIRLKAILTF